MAKYTSLSISYLLIFLFYKCYFYSILLHEYLHLSFMTLWNFQFYSKGSGIRSEVVKCIESDKWYQSESVSPSFLHWVAKKECESLWSDVVWVFIAVWTNILTLQPGFTLTVPDPDVPSEPVLLFDKDLSGDRGIFLNRNWDFIILESKLLFYLIGGWKKWMRLTKGCRKVHRLRVSCWHLLCVDLVLPFYFHDLLLFPLVPFS